MRRTAAALIFLVVVPIFSAPAPVRRICFYEAKKFGVSVLEASFSIEEEGPFILLTMTFSATGVLRSLFHVDNCFRSFIRKDGLLSVRYEKIVHQSSPFARNINYIDIVTFHPEAAKAVVERLDPPRRREQDVPAAAVDPLALIAKFLLDEEGAQRQSRSMTVFDGFFVRDLDLTLTSEKLETRCFGEIATVRLQSRLSFFSLGRKSGTLRIWFSCGERRVPVRISVEVPHLGDIHFELIKTEFEARVP